MNKKEISEIKKQFKFGNEDFLINKMAVYYIKEKDIKSSSIKNFADVSKMTNGIYDENCWSQNEEEYLLEIFKKTLSGQLGKSIMEYKIPNDLIINKDSKYTNLTDLHSDNLQSKKIIDKYIKFVVEQLDDNNEYAIALANCTYTPPFRDINGFRESKDIGITNDEYNFTILSVSPITLSKSGLCYNYKNNNIENISNKNKEIQMPINGFLFPAFNDRAADLGNIVIFNKKYKEPNLKLIENVLGCEYFMNADEEHEKFNKIITEALSSNNKDIDYALTQKLHSYISEIINVNSEDTQMATLSKKELRKILEKCNVDDAKLKNYDETFDKIMKNTNKKFNAVNVINSTKMDIKSPNVIINVKSEKTDLVSAKNIDGKKCLIVELNDEIEINGLNVKI